MSRVRLRSSSQASRLSTRSAVVARRRRPRCDGDLGVAAPGLGPVVLAEGGLLGGGVVGVVADDVGDQQGVGQAVRQVELGAQLVRHGVADAQEGVGEGDAGDGGGVVHLLPGPGVAGAVQVGGGQVLLEQPQGLERLGVGVLVGHDRDVGLQAVGHGVDAAEGGEALGQVHHQVGVDDGHGRGQLVVGDAGISCPVASSVTTANGVTSEPVPEVVGMATRIGLHAHASGTGRCACGCP